MTKEKEVSLSKELAKELPKELIQVRKSMLWILGILSIGVLDSIWLLFLHIYYGALSSVCAMGSKINCEVLQFHRFSQWLNIPVPVFSLLFYLFAVLVATWTLKKADKHAVRPYVYLWLLSWLSIGITGYFGYVSAFVLRTLCPFCAVLYLVNILFWFFSRKMMHTLNQPWGYLISKDLRSNYKSPWAWGPLVGSLVVLIPSHFIFKQQGKLSGIQFNLVGEEARTLGSSEASVVIIGFSDFQCPHCKIAAEVLKQLKEETHSKVRIVYKFYPLDPSCNAQVQWGKHKYACQAAQAAYCASVQERFWTYHDLLFENQEKLQESQLYELAKRAELNIPAFDLCLHDGRAKSEVLKDIKDGNGVGIEGTPTIFINGKKYSGPITVSGLKEAINSL